MSEKCTSQIRRDMKDPFIEVCRMWCVTQKNLDNGTTTNSQAAGCWSLMHCQTEVPSSQKPHQGQDSQPDCITTTYWVDCSIQGGESHPQSQQGVHCVST